MQPQRTGEQNARTPEPRAGTADRNGHSTRNIGDAAAALAENVVWHYFNPRLPELAGDYVGLQGINAFFDTLARDTADTFTVEPVSASEIGDELVVTHARVKLTLHGRAIVTDAVVVWRVRGDRIAEVWDIPAVHEDR